jgi:EthD domain
MSRRDGHAGAASVPDKFLYLAPRPDGADGAALGGLWREHGGGALLDRFTRHQQCETLTPADDPGLPEALFGPGGIRPDFGGVVLAWFAGGADAVAGAADAWAELGGGGSSSESTGGGAVAAPVRATGTLLATQEEVIFDLGGTRLTIFSFLHRQAVLSLAEFSDQWRAFADTFAAHGELTRHCSGYVQNHVYAPDGRPAFDGVAEMGFRSVADVVAFVSEPSMVEELFPAEEPFIDRTDGVVVLTRPLEV